MSQVDIGSLGLSNQDWLTYTHTNLTSDLDGEPTFFHIPSPSLGNLLGIVPVHLLVAPLLRGKESTPSRAVGLQRGTAFFASFLPLLLWFWIMAFLKTEKNIALVFSGTESSLW